MATISEYLQWVNALNHELRNGNLLQSLIEDNAEWIVDCVRNKQLYERGQNALGVSIADYQPYKPLTIQLKTEKNQPTDRVTLKDTGDFYESMRVEAEQTFFEIVADDWKTEELKEKYGDDILGLNEEHKAELIWDKIYPAALDYAKGLIFGGKDDI